MTDLMDRNYQATVNRGLINDNTGAHEFVDKLKEEMAEWVEAVEKSLPNSDEELADIILVCLAFASHFLIDIEKELINKIIKNEKR